MPRAPRPAAGVRTAVLLALAFLIVVPSVTHGCSSTSEVRAGLSERGASAPWGETGPVPRVQLFLPRVGDHTTTSPPIVPNHLVVRFGPGASETSKRVVRAVLGARVVADVPALGVEVLAVSEPQLRLPIARDLPGVDYAELDYMAGVPGILDGARGGPWVPDWLLMTPDDPLFPEQWHHEAIASAVAWERARADGVVVAVIDTGVNCDHPDLRGRCVAGYDFIYDDAAVRDHVGHGTLVAGILAAATDNGLGVAGVAWGAKLMPLRTLDENALGSYSDIARAIVWAVDHGATVVNMSIGGTADTDLLQDAVDYATGHGVTLVAAAGNSSSSEPRYPAAHAGVIGVAATTSTGTRASFSNYGDWVDVAAPGVNILSTVAGGGYARFDGTSTSAPIVAGLAALLLGHDPDLTPGKVEQTIEETANDLGAPGWDLYFGAGQVDAGRAISAVVQHAATPTPGPHPTEAPLCVPFRPGWTVEGDLDLAAPAVRYCFRGGDWVSVRMFGSGGFDPKLELYSAETGRLLAENDHGEGISENAFLTYRLVPGEYWLDAAGCCRGSYALRVEEGRSAGVGDVNRDCRVDEADYELIRASMYGWPDEAADLNLDGLTTPADVNIWRWNHARGLRCRP